MAKTDITAVQTSDTFQVWLNKTNELVEILQTDIMTASLAGDTTTGNATLAGSFTATTLSANTATANTVFTSILQHKTTATNYIESNSPIEIDTTVQNSLVIRSADGPRINLINGAARNWLVGLEDSTSTSSFIVALPGSVTPQLALDGSGNLAISGTLTAASISVSGTFTGSLTGNASSATILQNARSISATGDISWTIASFNGSANVSAAATIGNNAVTNAKFRQSAALSIVGRSANSTGNVADIAAGSDHQVLRRSGTSLAFGAIALNQSAAVTGTLPVANGGTGNATMTIGAILLGNGTSAIGTSADLSWNTGASTLTVNGSIAGTSIASIAEAQAGALNTKFMTPARTLAAINANANPYAVILNTTIAAGITTRTLKAAEHIRSGLGSYVSTYETWTFIQTGTARFSFEVKAQSGGVGGAVLRRVRNGVDTTVFTATTTSTSYTTLTTDQSVLPGDFFYVYVTGSSVVVGKSTTNYIGYVRNTSLNTSSSTYYIQTTPSIASAVRLGGADPGSGTTYGGIFSTYQPL